MSPSNGDTAPSKDVKTSSLKTIILKLRKRHIIETLAASIGGVKKRPGNVKVEILLVPLIMLVALAIDLNLILQIAGISGKEL